MSRAPGEHRDHLLDDPPVLSAERRPTAGPIAVLPLAKPQFVAAVEAAGARVSEISAETRGLIWLDEKDGAGLSTALDAYPEIEWVQLPWAGVDAFSSVLARYADRARPLWTSAKGAYSEPVAEHALALILALLRRFPEKARSTAWWTPPKVGTSLYGRRVVIVGAGGVAVELLRLLAIFDADVTVVRRSAGNVPGARRTVTADQLLSVLPEADVLVLAAASTEGTAHLIGARELAALSPEAVLVNVARGALVDQDALLAALRAGAIGGAGLDVMSPEPFPEGHPLWSESRCIITSHAADTPEMTVPLLAARVERNVRAFLEDGRFVGIVDPKAGY